MKSKIKHLFFLFFLLLTMINCSGISTLNSKEEIYSPTFLAKIEKVKQKYKNRQTEAALTELKFIKDAQINPTEFASKYNLIGVIYFSQNKFQLAQDQFNKALTKNILDKDLLGHLLKNYSF